MTFHDFLFLQNDKGGKIARVRAVDSFSNPGVLLVVDCFFLSFFLNPQISLKSEHKKPFLFSFLFIFVNFFIFETLYARIISYCLNVLLFLHINLF